jgi:predicted glycoside hydrolase/deacetylase ChbG (UPF0249 family)
MSIPAGTVIVNADDFGYSANINYAIMTCFSRGLISSATIMANMPGFDEACELAISGKLTNCIGVHLNLTEGLPLLPGLQGNPALCDASGRFLRNRPRFLSRTDRAMIAAEVSAQIERCQDAGLPLTHADSHQHVHNEPMVFMAIRPVLKRYGIRCVRISRNMDPLPITSPKRIAKACFNRWIAISGLHRTSYFGTVENLERFRAGGRLSNLSIEVLTHPSFDQDGILIDHLDNLPLFDRLKQAFRGVQLSSYAGVDAHRPQQLRAA